MTEQSTVSRDRDEIMRTLARFGVDDLAKYRIAYHLFSTPGTRLSPAHCAEVLGFRSVPRTQVALDELVRAGLLEVENDETTGRRYALRADAAAQIEASGVLAPEGRALPPDLRVLASRSLARIRTTRRAVPLTVAPGTSRVSVSSPR